MRETVNDRANSLFRRVGVLGLLLSLALGLVRPAQTSNVGVLRWAQRVSEFDESARSVADMAVDEEGNLLLVGRTAGEDGASDFLTVSYGPAGTRRWSAQYPGRRSDGGPSAVAVDLNGNVFVTGIGEGPAGGNSVWTTISYTPEGVLRWAAQYHGTQYYDDAPVDLNADRAGNVVLTGRSGSQLTTISYSPSGVERWVARYAVKESGESRPTALAVDATGNVFVTGGWTSYARPDYGRHDFLTVCYSAQGVQRWSARFSGTTHWRVAPEAIVIDHQGNACITGNLPGLDGYNEYTTVSYSPDGAERWAARYDGDKPSDASAVGLVVDSQDNVYVAGNTFHESRGEIATVSYTPDGVERWVRSYDGPEGRGGGVQALALDARDQLYLAGGTQESNADLAVVSYASTGAERWIGRYDGPEHGDDSALAVALAPNGDICVTGLSEVVPFQGYLVALKFHPDPPDTTAPTTRIGALTEGPGGPASYFPVRITDVDSGIAQVKLTSKSANCELAWDGPTGTVTRRIGHTLEFSPPVPSAQLRIIRLKGQRDCWVNLRAIDALGNASTRKIVVAELSGGRVKRLTRIHETFSKEEHFVRLQSGTPGISQAILWVNGRLIYRTRRIDGQVLDENLRYIFPESDHYRIDFSGTMNPGTTARLTIGAFDPDLGGDPSHAPGRPEDRPSP